VLWVIKLGTSVQIKTPSSPKSPTITVSTASGLGKFNLSRVDTNGSRPRAKKMAAKM
jgi:hypothetical protein